MNFNPAFFFRHRRSLLLAWLSVFILSLAYLWGHPTELSETQLEGARGTAAFQVMETLQQQFSLRLGNSADIVFDGAVSPRELKEAVSARFPQVASVRELTGFRPHLLQLFHLEFKPEFQSVQVQGLTSELRAFSHAFAHAHDRQAWLTGSIAFMRDSKEAGRSDSRRGEVFSLLVSLIVLIALFGSLGAALIPLLMAISTIVFFNAIANLCHVPIHPASLVLSSLVGMALSIDASLFIISRYREELARGRQPQEAMAVVMRQPRRMVWYSGLVMMSSIAALLVPDVSLARIMVYDLLLVIVLSLLGALFFLPTLLTLPQEWLDWPQGLTRLLRRIDAYAVWKRLASLVISHPRTCFILSALILLVLAAPMTSMKLWEPVQAIAPRDSESMQGYQQLVRDGWGGDLMPLQVLVKAKPGQTVYSADAISYLYDFSRAMEQHPKVMAVRGLASVREGFSKEQYQALYRVLSLGILGQPEALAHFVNTKFGSNLSLVLIAPRDLMSQEDSSQIVEEIHRYAALHPQCEVQVGGMVPRVKDFTRELYRSTPLVIGLVVISTYLLLYFYLKSVILPIKAAVMNFLPVLSALGFLTLVYQEGLLSSWLHTPINGAVTNIVPVVLFCLVYGLGMDYEILILSRMTEAYHSSSNQLEALTEGLARSGSIVTGAAIILVGVFLAGTGSSSPQTQEICLGVSFALLIDATIVRFLMVPSFIVLLGRWNWWNPLRKP